MRSETMYRILVGTIFILLMVIGIYLGLEFSGKDEKQPVIISSTDDVKIYESEADKKNETEPEEEIGEVVVKFTNIYPECGHSMESEEKYQNTTKSAVREEIESKDTAYRLIGEQDGVMLYEKVHAGKCMNHYKVCLENNRVMIYRIGENNEYELYQETDITQDMIRETVAEQLKEGIEVDDIEELFLLMEDIES